MNLDPHKSICRSLAQRGVRATPQAISALLELIRRSSFDVAGDTDTILNGLLHSGSYTVDVLLTAGVSRTRLRRLASSTSNSEATERGFANDDVFREALRIMVSEEGALGRTLSTVAATGRTLETADLLVAAINPVPADAFESFFFPIEQRRDTPGTTELQAQLEHDVCEMLSFVRYGIGCAIDGTFATRTAPITPSEDHSLDVVLGKNFRGMQVDELEFIVAALNSWFSYRRVLTDPPDLCLRAIMRTASLLFGPSHFVESGGNIKSVDIGLATARRISPERDLPAIGLFLRGDRVHIGQYTYRNTFSIEESERNARGRHVSIQAVRPVSLVSQPTIEQFEQLLSRESISELRIQRFLVEHGELLEALGYARAMPHVCLRDEEGNELIPDFILEKPGGLGFDVLDLKLPTSNIVARAPFVRMSHEVTRALAQLRKYGKYFERAENRRWFHKQYGLEAFCPELIVMIGRRSSFQTRDERVETERQVPELRIVTYDDLADYGRSRSIILP